ncbi:MAG TPA: hypothetical protein VJ440_11160 [Candidatus Brocadiaceae bacterium]|nr:hypothetical protein [Candidatus Brocadiaceae bacterium]
MSKKADGRMAEEKIREALTILNNLGFPEQQQNERSALTLLSLLGMKPDTHWGDADDPLMGITPMMDNFKGTMVANRCAN